MLRIHSTQAGRHPAIETHLRQDYRNLRSKVRNLLSSSNCPTDMHRKRITNRLAFCYREIHGTQRWSTRKQSVPELYSGSEKLKAFSPFKALSENQIRMLNQNQQYFFTEEQQASFQSFLKEQSRLNNRKGLTMAQPVTDEQDTFFSRTNGFRVLRTVNMSERKSKIKEHPAFKTHYCWDRHQTQVLPQTSSLKIAHREQLSFERGNEFNSKQNLQHSSWHQRRALLASKFQQKRQILEQQCKINNAFIKTMRKEKQQKNEAQKAKILTERVRSIEKESLDHQAKTEYIRKHVIGVGINIRTLEKRLQQACLNRSQAVQHSTLDQ